MRAGHDPLAVEWQWPFVRLLRYVHAEMRRAGTKTYFTNKPQVSMAELETARARVLSALDDALL